MSRKVLIKLFIITASAVILFFPCKAQRIPTESLKEKLIQHTAPDTSRVNLLNELARRTDLSPSHRDSLLNESLELSRKLNYSIGEANALGNISSYTDKSKGVEIAKQAIAAAEKSGDKRTIFWAYRALGQAMLYTSESNKSNAPFSTALEAAVATGDPSLVIAGQLAFVDYYKNVKVIYPVALEWALKAMHTAEEHHDTTDLPIVYRNLGLVYLMIGEEEKSITHLQKALTASRQTGDQQTEEYVLNDIGEHYRLSGMYPEALKAYSEAALLIKDPFNIELNESNVADTYQRMGNDDSSFVHAFRALRGAQQLKDTIGIAWIDNILSRAYLHAGKTDSALHYGLQGYDFASQTQTPEFQRDNSEALANAYFKNKNFDKALYFYKIYIAARDSMLNNEIALKTNLAQYNYDLQKKQAEISVLNKDRELQQVLVQRQRFMLAGTVTILAIIITSLLFLYRSYMKRKKANIRLREQNIEIQEQRNQAHKTLAELKLTQEQLIQAEKMAAFGVMASRVSHEIQNPLNFVNNFSELAEEMVNDIVKLNSEHERSETAKDLISNLQKIKHHGKRADTIVKQLQEHTRAGTAHEYFDGNKSGDSDTFENSK